MSFKENIKKCCREKNTTLTRVMKELGISTSKVTAINNGSIPSEELLIKIARHIGCRVMDFFVYDDLLQNVEVNKDNLEDVNERDLLVSYRMLSRSNQHKLLAYLFDLLEGNSDR